MLDFSADTLSDDMIAALRSVQSGEHILIAIDGHGVAKFVPVPHRPVFMPWDEFMRDCETWRADAGLANELRDLLKDSTDDGPLPPSGSPVR
jgi:antitoxin (DNA-binding transcriptional repressor) of toxin-antitoxin stability system